jgi:hypothetical protein
MKWSIQVNVGYPGTPDWRWIHDHDFERGEYDTKEEAESARKTRYPGAKVSLFRVHPIDEGT